MEEESRYSRFRAIAASFVGRRGLLVESGPAIEPVVVEEVGCDAQGMHAWITRRDGSRAEVTARWEVFTYDPDFWQVTYANVRVVFDAEAVRLFDAGEPFEIDDYL